MRRTRNLFTGLSLLGLIVACGVGSSIVEDAAEEERAALESGGGLAPMFEVDPLWPKNLPNHWLMGATIGVDVDSRDPHTGSSTATRRTSFVARTEIGLVQDPPLSECCAPGPPVLEFDQEGNLLSSWGGPGTETGDYTWPVSNHGITIDHMDNVWIGGNGGPDSHVLKFARDGSFLKQFGAFGARAAGEEDGRAAVRARQPRRRQLRARGQDRDRPGRQRGVPGGRLPEPAGRRHRHGDGRAQALLGRVRQRARRQPRPPAATCRAPSRAPQFRGPVHCSEISNDGLVYVCDRAEDRIQVFRKDGTFVTEAIVAPNTLSQGSTWDIDFSHDAEQTYLYLADGQNMKVYILLRETLEVLTAFGDGGRQPGHVLRRAQHRRRLGREHLHDRDLRGVPRAEVRLQGHGTDSGRRRGHEQPGRALAYGVIANPGAQGAAGSWRSVTSAKVSSMAARRARAPASSFR